MYANRLNSLDSCTVYRSCL